MRTLILILATVFSMTIAEAQVVVQNQESRMVPRSIYGLGLAAGFASGFGLSFRHHLPGFFSYQIIAGVIKVDKETDYNVGGELQFDIMRGDISRFFADVAMGYFYSGDKGRNKLDGPYREGLGFGWEWMTVGPMNFTTELLFTNFSDGTILPLPQFSAHYYFF